MQTEDVRTDRPIVGGFPTTSSQSHQCLGNETFETYSTLGAKCRLSYIQEDELTSLIERARDRYRNSHQLFLDLWSEYLEQMPLLQHIAVQQNRFYGINLVSWK